LNEATWGKDSARGHYPWLGPSVEGAK
jgi:hypothetical protein